MNNLIKKYIDTTVLFTGLHQFWKLISGLLTLILIPMFLTKEEQGYWFTIMSMATLVMLADLGFSNIIMQFAAHEFAFLRFDDMIRILDKNGKGNTRKDESVAKAMIPQGVWRRMFREIKSNAKLKDLLNNIFIEKDDKEKIRLINELYEKNTSGKNSLTGKSAIAINTILFAHAIEHISVVSLGDRRKIIEFFGFSGGPNFDVDSPGKKIVMSNNAIIAGFKSLGINASPRTISTFLYNS